MKLSFKIFLGICISSITATVMVAYIFVTRSFRINIDNEIDRCVKEIGIMEGYIEDSLDKSTAEDKTILNSYVEYYQDKNTYLAYFEGKKEICKSNDSITIKNTELLDVNNDKVLSTTQEIDGKKYLLLSSKLDNDGVLVYIRNINSIYEIRKDLIKFSVILMGIMLFLIAGIAYLISKTLTKPLDKMQKEMIKLQNGDFNINLKETKDEFGKLAKNFNRMSKELETRNSELIEMINSKQIFIDNMSHEINTPLTLIQGYAELLEKANCTEEQKMNFLASIQDETKKINDMHKKLLLLSYKRNADLEKRNFDARKMFDKIENNICTKIQEKRLNLIIENSIVNIYGDETLIIMCVTNLINNAINASQMEKTIWIKSYEEGLKQYIYVIDEGKGIPIEHINKIIEPFYRVDKARSRQNGGAGLGLSICKSIMELHNGQLIIKSKIDEGSTFILEFPKK